MKSPPTILRKKHAIIFDFLLCKKKTCKILFCNVPSECKIKDVREDLIRSVGAKNLFLRISSNKNYTCSLEEYNFTNINIDAYFDSIPENSCLFAITYKKEKQKKATPHLSKVVVIISYPPNDVHNVIKECLLKTSPEFILLSYH